MDIDDLTWLTTRELAGQLASGAVSSEEALGAHYARIEKVNPTINAVVTLEPERAALEAREADARLVKARASSEELGPLFGVPMTHKDTHDTAGIRTTSGSPIFQTRVPEFDDLIVSRLRSAGVISTGKTNVPEFAAGGHTFNTVFGTTYNPFDLSKSAGGSTGGTAAAIAVGIQASGDGSDMAGSLRTPASFNNVVGMRPSIGRVPQAPPGNPWAWLSQKGFMGRTVGDVALLMSVGAGPHPDGPTSLQEPGSVFDLPEFRLQNSFEPTLRGLRVGISADIGGLIDVDPQIREVVLASVQVFATLGAEVSEGAPSIAEADSVFKIQRAYEFAYSWGDLLKEEEARNSGPRIKKAVVWNTRLGRELTIDDFIARDRARCRLWCATRRFFEEHDVFVTASSQVLPFDAGVEFPDNVNGKRLHTYLDWLRAVTLISATGCPAISVPGGFSKEGLPIGIQIVSAPGRDVDLLRVAHAFEAMTNYSQVRPGHGRVGYAESGRE